MFFSREEVRLARTMQSAGLFWRVRIGHWYVTRDGFVGLVKGQGEGEECQRLHTWLPTWTDARAWLKERGFAHPEFLEDGEEVVTIARRDGRDEELRVSGSSDLACLYQAIIKVLDSLLAQERKDQ